MRRGRAPARTDRDWRPDGTGIDSMGDCGGDIQRGDSYSVRFSRPDMPTARVTVTFYAAEYDECPGEFLVQRQVEFLVGEDPANLSDTELWERTDYDDVTYEVMDTEEEADAEALRLATSALGSADYINWDGQPEWGA
jgi:hypothetical protein